MEELKKSLALKAVVVRDGKMAEIDAVEVVPGDILKVDEVVSHPMFVLRRQKLTFGRVRLCPLTAVSRRTAYYKSTNPLSPVNR